MDPLAIFGGVGELLNAFLGDFEPISNGEFAAHEVFQGVEVFDYQRRHDEFLSPKRMAWASASIQQHVGHEGRADLLALRIGEIDASNAQS